MHLYWALGGSTGLAESAGSRLAVQVLLLADVDYGSDAVSADQRFWTLVGSNPCFLLGGIAFARASVAARPATARL